MKKLFLMTSMVVAFGLPVISQASPEEDLKTFRDYYMDRFPDTPFEDFSNGVYSIDKGSRDQWEALEEYPPYELAIADGEELFNTPFANGKTYGSCFRNNGIGVKSDYPYYDENRGQVVTLELAINDCRTANGEKPLKYKTGKLASISAYMAYTTRGQTVNIPTPTHPGALAAYEKGKRFYYTRRGQLNMACAHCHVDNAGNKVRTEILSPSLGHMTHFPKYRLKWGGMGTVHRRVAGCNKQVRAKPFKAQSEQYRNLEYFLTYLSNDLPWNGPGVRK